MIHTTKVFPYDDENCFVFLPESLVKKHDLKEGDEVEMDVVEQRLIVRLPVAAD